MAIKSDKWILRMCQEKELIYPFETELISKIHTGYYNAETLEGIYTKVISYGVSSYGYDCRLAADEFKVFSPVYGTEINPKNFDAGILLDVSLKTDEEDANYWLVPPHSYGLGITLERFNIPRRVTAICLNKSTYARCGLIVNPTIIEPCWKGRLVVEFFNAANLPIRIYENEGFFQLLFLESDEDCAISYEDRKGKYQNQKGLVLAKLKDD